MHAAKICNSENTLGNQSSDRETKQNYNDTYGTQEERLQMERAINVDQYH
jgi:hypothetical protein